MLVKDSLKSRHVVGIVVVNVICQSDICRSNPHIDFRQRHVPLAGITGWKNRGEGIAALFGGVVILHVRLPRHAPNDDRGGFGILPHGIPGRAQRGGQV